MHLDQLNPSAGISNYLLFASSYLFRLAYLCRGAMHGLRRKAYTIFVENEVNQGNFRLTIANGRKQV